MSESLSIFCLVEIVGNVFVHSRCKNYIIFSPFYLKLVYFRLEQIRDQGERHRCDKNYDSRGSYGHIPRGYIIRRQICVFRLFRAFRVPA